jgi:hypothetical protein
MKETSFTKRRNQWQALITEQRASGLSIADFCKLRNVGRSSFSNWSRSLKKEKPATASGFAKVIEHKDVGVAAHVPLKIEFKNGTCLHLAVTPEAEWLAEILKLIA